MPISAMKVPKYVNPKPSIVSWDTWKEGLNLLQRENELKGSEVVKADNLILIGSGVPTKRWGSLDFFLSAPTGGTKYVGFSKDVNDNIQILSMTDWGILTKKSGSSYTPILGASWPSGERPSSTQLGDNVYLVSENREIVRYNLSTLVSFPTIATPTNIRATNLSSATGTTTWSWRITASGASGGETIGSTAFSLPTMPEDLTKTVVRVNWDPVSAPSGALGGYNIYRGSLGNEKWLTGVNSTTTSFDDTGTNITDPTKTLPLADTTGGLKAKHIIRYQDRLVLAGIKDHPTRVYISGRYPDHERFDVYAGGNFVDVEPDSGENITGLGIYQEKLVIFKENSVWEIALNLIETPLLSILEPQYKLLTASQGCSSHRSIVAVENDLMFANRKGIYILRYEPQLLTVINANEISAKIRPFFESLSDSDLTMCAGAYIDKKYVLSFPISKQSIIFDRERLSFMGPWTTPFGISQWLRYIDSTGEERWVAADHDDNYVTEFSANYEDDKGTPIQTIFKTKREDFKDWTLMKTINEVYMSFQSIKGEVQINIYIEDREGSTISAKSFTLSESGASGTSGMGMDEFGDFLMGETDESPTAATFTVQKKAFIYKSSRVFQIEIRTDNSADNYELLGVKTISIAQARGNSPSSWNIS